MQSQIVFLDVSQRDQLERWRFKSQALRDKHVKVKNDLLEFENMALNLDGLKKKFTDLKVRKWKNSTAFEYKKFSINFLDIKCISN